MPNWCEGNLRLRGTGRAILEFIKNEIEVVGHVGGLIGEHKTCAPEIEETYGDVEAKIPEQAKGWAFLSFYIKDTRRNFIDGKSIDFYIGEEDELEEKHVVCIDGVRAAWAFIAEPYVEKAKKYGLDIKIVGFERGMEFAQIIEIVDGELCKDHEIKFDDWKWECIMPNMGG